MVRFVVMGAGKATRMGQDKLAMPWGETTILGHVIHTILWSNNIMATRETLLTEKQKAKPEIIVIARKPQTEFLSSEFFSSKFTSEISIDNDMQNVQKPNFEWRQVSNPRPLADTIHLGLSELPDDIEGICFVPGDQVGIDSNTLADLTTFFLKNTPDFLIPHAGEIPGSPVFFHRRYLPDLLSLEGEKGGKAVLQKYRERWTTYPVKQEFLLDVDTPEEYEAFTLAIAQNNRL